MRTPATSELLAVWERGADHGPVAGALALLEATGAGGGALPVAELSVGRRDAALLEIRRALFGPTLDGVAACPACGDTLELTWDVAAVVASPAERAGPLALRQDGWEIDFRLPDGADAVAASACGDVAAARRLLLERCVLRARQRDTAVAAGDLPGDVTAAVGERMVEADPQADVELALTCPACAAQWSAPFDPARFLWCELDAWASRTLADVHVLAAAYGWSEHEVLALGAQRRAAYLDLVETS